MNFDYSLIIENLKNKMNDEFNIKVEKNSFLSYLINTFAFGLYRVYRDFNNLILQTFAHTADLEHLQLQAQERIKPLNGFKAKGVIVLSSDEVPKEINSGEIFYYLDLQYKLLDSTIIDKKILDNDNLDSLVSNEKEAILTFKTRHNLINDLIIDIKNSDDNTFDGTWQISILDDYKIKFIIDNANENEDSLTDIEISLNIGYGDIEALEIGSKYNLNPYFKLDNDNVDINQSAVNFNSLYGGKDNETLEQFRLRFLDYIRTPQAFFNENFIKSQILNKFSDVTRVFIKFDRDNAIIYIYVVNDNATNYLVSDSTINSIKEFIETIKPINLSDYEVLNPNQQEINIDITNLIPSIQDFKELVRINTIYYINSLDMGEDILIDKLKAFIYNIYNPNDNTKVISFDIDPNNDISINDDSIAIVNLTVT
jgi:hypothetical protein